MDRILSGPFNYPIKPDNSVLISQNTDNVDELPILKSEVEDAIQKQKEDKSPSIDNIPGELLKYGGDASLMFSQNYVNYHGIRKNGQNNGQSTNSKKRQSQKV